MAQITLYKKTTPTNWDATNAWNTAADGTGTDYTNPQNGADTYICDLNSKTTTLNVDVVVDCVKATTSTGFLQCSTTRTLTAQLQYSSTSTSGMVQVTANTLTVNPSGVTGIANSSSGYCVVVSSTGSFTLNVGSGSTAISNTGSGQGVRVTASSSTITITGNVISGGTGYGIVVAASATVTINGNVSDGGSNYQWGVWNNNGSANVTINGTVTSTSTGTQGLCYFTAGTLTINDTVTASGSGYAVQSTGTVTITKSGGTAISNTSTGIGLMVNNATATITGNVSNTGSGASSAAIYTANASGVTTLTGNVSNSVGVPAIRIVNGTVNWTGTASLAANTEGYILLSTGTLALATASAVLSHSCAGNLIISKASGTTLTTTAAAGTASIVRSAVTGNAVCCGQDISAIVTGPTLPSASNVWYGSGTYGYSGGTTTPTKRASSITNCSAGNVKSGVVIDDVTGSYTGTAASIVPSFGGKFVRVA